MIKYLNYLKEYFLIKRSGLFDANHYYLNYPDVRRADINPLLHFIKFGWQEGRNPSPFFVTNFYLGQNREVLNAKINPLLHYIQYGGFEGRDPNPDFDSSWYWDTYDDVKNSGINPLIHFVKYGQEEGRQTKNRIISISRVKDTPKVSPHFSLPDLDIWYKNWIDENEPNKIELQNQKKIALNLEIRPLISVLTPVFNPPVNVMERMITSVINQTYDCWELCLVNGNPANSDVSEKLEEFSRMDPRIKIKNLPENLGISDNTNIALNMAQGDYITLLDHDDLLPQLSLFEYALYINKHPDVKMIYGDEDRISIDDERSSPFFKPDWSPDLLQAFMYVGHCTYDKKMIVEIGSFRSEYDFSQDYDLALRVTEQLQNVGHIPKILYHWRMIEGSAASGEKDYARKSNLAALRDAIKRRGLSAEVIELPSSNCVKFDAMNENFVSIIIPSDDIQNVVDCVSSILSKTEYPNFEIILVINSEMGKRLTKELINDDRIRMVYFDKPYNFSAKCNVGVNAAMGDFILFMNDDVFPNNADWLSWLVGPFQQQEIGAVAPKLVYFDGSVQHAGLVTGVRGFFGTAFHAYYQDTPFYFNLLQSPRTVSALSSACMIMRKSVFVEINGYDEVNTPIMHSDLDLCFKIRQAGLRLVYTPYTMLSHFGHKSLSKAEAGGFIHSDKVDLFMVKKWTDYVNYDPYFPVNMRDLLYIDSPVWVRTYLGDQTHQLEATADILIQSHELTYTGAPLVVKQVTELLTREGYFVNVISPAKGELQEEYMEGNIPLIIDPLIMSQPEQLILLLRNFDLVIANTIGAWALVNYIKSIKKKVIWYIHESNYGFEQATKNINIRKALNDADLVIFPSKQTLNKYKVINIGNNFISIPHGIDDPIIKHSIKPSHDQSIIKVVTVGSIEHRKGQDTLIKAVEKLSDKIIDNFEFYIVGKNLQQSFAEQLINKTKSLLNIHWVGEVTHSEALQYISESDIVICSSRDETGPLVVYEAMSLGKAVISTPVGVVPEFISHGHNGFLFSRECDEELTRLLAHLEEQRDLIIEIGHEARKTFLEKMNSQIYYRSLLDNIQKVIKS